MCVVFRDYTSFLTLIFTTTRIFFSSLRAERTILKTRVSVRATADAKTSSTTAESNRLHSCVIFAHKTRYRGKTSSPRHVMKKIGLAHIINVYIYKKKEKTSVKNIKFIIRMYNDLTAFCTRMPPDIERVSGKLNHYTTRHYDR